MFFQDRRTAGYAARDHYAFQSKLTYAFMADDQETDEFVHVDASDAVDPADAETESIPQHVDASDDVNPEDNESVPHHGQQGDSIDVDLSDDDGTNFLDRMNQEKEENVTNLREKLRRRSTVEQLQERGILKEFAEQNQNGMADSTQIESTNTMSTLGDEPSPEPIEPFQPLEPTPNGGPPRKRQSIIRPTMETRIKRDDFRKYKGQIKRRLSAQQRMPFEQLINRNIHGGLDNELHDSKPTETFKKKMQLERKLPFRPQPDTIQEDSDLPKDLKLADAEYYKLYGNKYRGPATEKEKIVCFHFVSDRLHQIFAPKCVRKICTLKVVDPLKCSPQCFVNGIYSVFCIHQID